MEDNGSSLTRVELDADQMKGETHTGESGLATRLPGASDVSLMSFCKDVSCHPASFAADTEEAPAVDELVLAVESNVLK